LELKSVYEEIIIDFGMEYTKSRTKVVLVDDHRLFRKGIVELINAFPQYQVIWEADNGKEFLKYLCSYERPDIVLLDIAMPVMNGYQTAEWLKINEPKLKFLVLSMYDSEEAIIKMIKLGAGGYILKDADPEELHLALNDINQKGYYCSESMSETLLHTIQNQDGNNNRVKDCLSSKELEFLILACSELTYKEIADKMCLSVRTIDGYRDALFEKLSVKSRVGLVLFAIKNEIVKLD
jgi:two-component system invasion response regulator UvrY